MTGSDLVFGRVYPNGTEWFYTAELREHDGLTLGLGSEVPAALSVVILPMTNSHVTVVIRPSSCTEQGLRGQEVIIFAGILHTHTTGSAVRYMQFSQNTELPWILHDDNDNFNFQQFRVLYRERRLLPGDVLIKRCEYDTTRRNGSAVVGGFGTYEAMCAGNLYFYPRQAGFSVCRSLIRDEGYWDLLKVGNATWDTANRPVVVSDPPQFAGLSVLEHVNRNINWNGNFRKELQGRQLFSPQVCFCPNTTWVQELSESELIEFRTRGTFPPLQTQLNSQHPSRYPSSNPRYTKHQQCFSN